MSNEESLDYLFSPKAIRERCVLVYEKVLSGKGLFKIDKEKIPECSEFVIGVIRENYPDLNIPFHSRLGHFQAGQFDRLKILNERLENCDTLEKLRTYWDLIITSVLLDAGAGDKWSYFDPISKDKFSRSEGLGIASLNLFLDGGLSDDKKNPLKVTAASLKRFNSSRLRKSFQVELHNPLNGLEGRANLLQKLGVVIEENPKFFPGGRPGSLVDYLVENYGQRILAGDILKTLSYSLGEIWPGRLTLKGRNLGDVWSSELLGLKDSYESLVPFHKLAQWLTYSLIVPMFDAGIEVSGVHELTGLPEYRNGGLLIDSGVLKVKDSSFFHKIHKPSDELVVEWRALTVILLDRIADEIRLEFGKSEEELPLAKILEGGTWHAGRKLAKEKREGLPPLEIESDGTVF